MGMENDDMQEFRKKGTTPMEPWTPHVDMAGVSVSNSDREAGSPKPGDWIAHGKPGTGDRWLVSAKYHAEHYEAVIPQ